MNRVVIALRGFRCRQVAFAGAACVALAAPAFAQSFDELAFRLLDHPEIASIRLNTEAQRQMVAAAGALPDPVISLGVNNVPISDPAFDRFLPTNKAIAIQQRIPNGKLRTAMATGARASANVSTQEAGYRLAQLRAELISALADKSSVREQIELAVQRQHTLEALDTALASEIEAGRALIFQVARIDVSRSQVARQLAAYQAELQRLDARLIALVGEAVDTAPPASPAPVWHGDPDEFHEVRLARASIGIAEANVDRAQAGYRPEWGLNLMYQQREAGGNGADFSGDDWFSASFTFTVPLWSRSSQAPRVRAASARQLAARNGWQATIREVLARWATLEAAARASSESARMLTQSLSAVEEQVQALTVNYEGGFGDYLPVLEAQLAGLELRTELARERSRKIALLAEAQSMLVSP